MSLRRIRKTLRLAYIVNAYGQRGRVDRIECYFGRSTLGGHGHIESYSVTVRYSRSAIEQFIALTGHANDGQDGKPLEPTMEMPF